MGDTHLCGNGAGLNQKRETMAELSNLAYIVLEVSDLRQWEDFAVDVIGMQAGERGDGTLDLRVDDYPWRIRLEQGPADDLMVAGWSLDDEAALLAYVEGVRAAGGDVRRADEDLARSRGVQALYVLDDPIGFRHEFFHGRAAAGTPFRSAVLTGPGFKTGDLGLGHILPVAKDYAASKRFYTEVMGLRLSDIIQEELAPGIVADATFFHSRTGRHHSLATGQFPSRRRLNHFMVELLSMDDVGYAYDRARKAGYRILLHLGHHPNDKMFSFYVEAPSGFGVEVGHGGIVIDDGDWQVVTYTKMSDWGHQRAAALVPEPSPKA